MSKFKVGDRVARPPLFPLEVVRLGTVREVYTDHKSNTGVYIDLYAIEWDHMMGQIMRGYLDVGIFALEPPILLPPSVI